LTGSNSHLGTWGCFTQSWLRCVIFRLVPWKVSTSRKPVNLCHSVNKT